MVDSSLRLFINVGGEADAAALRWRRVHELPDGREHGGDGLVVRAILKPPPQPR